MSKERRSRTRETGVPSSRSSRVVFLFRVFVAFVLLVLWMKTIQLYIINTIDVRIPVIRSFTSAGCANDEYFWNC